jgi:hypothetical protein
MEKAICTFSISGVQSNHTQQNLREGEKSEGGYLRGSKLAGPLHGKKA